MSRSADPRLAAIDAGEVLQGPETLHVDLTNACNLACVTCWDHSPLLAAPRPAAWKRQRADPERVLALIDEALGLGGLSRVILSGMGEPLTHPDVYTLVEAIRGRGVAVTLITNLIAGDMERLLACDPDELLVGVHAASAETYRAFHPGCPDGAFAELLGRLDALVAAGRTEDKHVHVICAVNARELPAMVRLAREHGCGRITFKLASLRGGTERCALDETERRRLIREELPAARAEAEALDVDCNLDVLAAQLATGGPDTAPIEEVGCFMGYLYARVLVDGTVLYCCADEIVVGSLEENSPSTAERPKDASRANAFAELWRGPAWRTLRSRLREGRYFAACRRCGKLNQNLKVGRRFAARYGEERRRQVCGEEKP